MTARALRVVVWIVTVQVALQPVFAGSFLDGNATAHGLHSASGSLLQLTALALLVTSVLAWRPGRAPGRVAVAGTLMFVIVGIQVAAGYVRFLSLHVPLGVAALLLMLWLLVSTRNLTRAGTSPDSTSAIKTPTTTSPTTTPRSDRP